MAIGEVMFLVFGKKILHIKENNCLLLNIFFYFFTHLLTAAISQFDGRSNMHSKKSQEKGYRVEWIKVFCNGYPFFWCRGGDLFLTLRGVHPPPFPPPSCPSVT